MIDIDKTARVFLHALVDEACEIASKTLTQIPIFTEQNQEDVKVAGIFLASLMKAVKQRRKELGN